MDAYKKLLLSNKAWVAEKLAIRADYFERTATTQTPAYLWIGCSDSRVPAESVTSTEPGELFVHRNIANLVVHTDLNMLSVLQYAVEVLEVKHIIVCGHYGCGGVRNAMTNRSFGLIDKWLRHIKDVYRVHRRDLETLADVDKRLDRLVEFNVAEQVQNLAETSFVQHAWALHNRPTLHGWVYDIRTGFLKEHALMKPGTPLEDIYRFDFDDVPRSEH
ncbi:carbonic anhydrase [Polyangium mundeleinium]|uniref:Carbonic anhydrase n=1 Tax=Polyangium mundeleinium TaxID=2995306 RepID=A0ABT5F6A7_9BACT|nr:carbonic anhydrase [Polyangium mundeleinium]MDC0749644.1 carbonic anhydrase [Polyangium mundeleinium]